MSLDSINLLREAIESASSLLEFDEEKHLYCYDGTECLSVTSFIDDLFEGFNGKATVERYYNRWQRDPEHRYNGMSKDEILGLWESKGEKALKLGTQMHTMIEHIIKNGNDDVQHEEELRKELLQFKAFCREYPSLFKHQPISEQRFAHEELQIAGTIDLICQDTKTNKITIIDWKRSAKNLDNERCFKMSLQSSVLPNIQDTRLERYTLQLNIYRILLENVIPNNKVERMLIVQLHEDLDNFKVTPIHRKDDDALIGALKDHLVHRKVQRSGNVSDEDDTAEQSLVDALNPLTLNG